MRPSSIKVCQHSKRDLTFPTRDLKFATQDLKCGVGFGQFVKLSPKWEIPHGIFVLGKSARMHSRTRGCHSRTRGCQRVPSLLSILMCCTKDPGTWYKHMNRVLPTSAAGTEVHPGCPPGRTSGCEALPTTETHGIHSYMYTYIIHVYIYMYTCIRCHTRGMHACTHTPSIG